MTEKDRENVGSLAIENVDKIVMAKTAKMLSTIDFNNMYNWVINNADIDVVKNLKLTGIKKYLICICQI